MTDDPDTPVNPNAASIRMSSEEEGRSSNTDVNHFIASGNLHEFAVWSLQSGRLLILGSDDMAYYHQLEVWFDEVQYLDLPSSLSSPRFHPATVEERAAHPRRATFDPDATLYAVVDSFGEDSTTYFVCASTMSWTSGRVFHYARANLQPGERIAPWVDRKE